jgi:hypothetical protein
MGPRHRHRLHRPRLGERPAAWPLPRELISHLGTALTLRAQRSAGTEASAAAARPGSGEIPTANPPCQQARTPRQAPGRSSRTEAQRGRRAQR